MRTIVILEVSHNRALPVELLADHSGNGDDLQVPNAQGKYLCVDKATAWLDAPGFRDFQMTGKVNGQMPWTPMTTLVNGKVEHATYPA